MGGGENSQIIQAQQLKEKINEYQTIPTWWPRQGNL